MSLEKLILVAVTTCLIFDDQIKVQSVPVFSQRCNSTTQEMSFVYANEQPPFEVFSIGRQCSCGKQARTTTGTGTHSDPLVLTTRLSGGSTLTQSPDCGVIPTIPNHFQFTVKVLSSCGDPNDQDVDFTVECVFEGLLNYSVEEIPLP